MAAVRETAVRETTEAGIAGRLAVTDAASAEIVEEMAACVSDAIAAAEFGIWTAEEGCYAATAAEAEDLAEAKAQIGRAKADIVRLAAALRTWRLADAERTASRLTGAVLSLCGVLTPYHLMTNDEARRANDAVDEALSARASAWAQASAGGVRGDSTSPGPCQEDATAAAESAENTDITADTAESVRAIADALSGSAGDVADLIGAAIADAIRPRQSTGHRRETP